MRKRKKAKVIRKMDAGDLIYIFFIFVIIAQPVPLGAAFVTKVLQVSAIYDKLSLQFYIILRSL